MKSILPIIIAVLVTAVASSSITYFVTVDKNGEKEEAEVNIEVENNQDDNSFSSRPLTGQAQIVTGSSAENAVEIKSAELAKTKDGEDAVIITFVYSRISGDENAYYLEFNYPVVYQNGVGLEKCYDHEFVNPGDWGDKDLYVRAGYSNEFMLAFLLRDSNGDIVVECVEDNYGSDYVVSRTFELN